MTGLRLAGHVVPGWGLVTPVRETNRSMRGESQQNVVGGG